MSYFIDILFKNVTLSLSGYVNSKPDLHEILKFYVVKQCLTNYSNFDKINILNKYLFMLFKGFRFYDFIYFRKYLLSITEIRKFCFNSGFSLVKHYLYTVLYGLSFVNAILYTMHLLLKKFASISDFNKKKYMRYIQFRKK